MLQSVRQRRKPCIICQQAVHEAREDGAGRKQGRCGAKDGCACDDGPAGREAIDEPCEGDAAGVSDKRWEGDYECCGPKDCPAARDVTPLSGNRGEPFEYTLVEDEEEDA